MPKLCRLEKTPFINAHVSVGQLDGSSKCVSGSADLGWAPSVSAVSCWIHQGLAGLSWP